MQTSFVKPTDRATEAEREQGTLVFQPSNRIKAFLKGNSSSLGFSCNTFQVEDNIESIGEFYSWMLNVLKCEGAPSGDLSNLRAKGSVLKSGGTSSGAASFTKPADSIVSIMRRQEKKNGAGILYLDYRHPDLDDFLALETQAAYKAIYLPMHDTPEAEELLADEAMLKKLAKAYDYFKCFLVKRPLPAKGSINWHPENISTEEPLFVNLCTEVEIPHKGFCILGAVNLSYFTETNLHLLPSYFRLAAIKMYDYMCQAESASKLSSLACESPANRQFGLGVFGLASLLGRLGITYREFAEELEFAFSGEDSNASIHTLAAYYESYTDKRATQIVGQLLKAYSEVTELMEGKVRAAFCIQPTVNIAQRSFDCEGYHASPEIAPVQGLRHADAVSTIIKSEISDKKIDYHPQTWTMEDVPYEDYALVSALLQRLLDSTGLAHRHSHCFYGEKFTVEDLRAFYVGDTRYRKSLYYRLSFNVNPLSLDKSQLWQETNESELLPEGFDVDALLAGGSCQMKGDVECECTM